MRVSGVDPSWLRGFSLKKRCGRLGCFEAYLHLPAGEIDVWLKRPGQELAVTGEPPEEEPLFYGTVTMAAAERRKGCVTAQLRAVSGAVSQTTPVFRRLFQKPKKTFGDTLAASRLKMENCDLELDQGLRSEPLAPLILQRESNFAFIKRLARVSGRRMWVIDTREGKPAIALAHCLDTAVMKFKAAEIQCLRRVALVGSEHLELASERYCPLGRIAQVNGIAGKYLVTGLSCSREHGRDVFRYTLERYEEDKPTGKNPEEGRFAILPGKVADTADPDKLGRVRFAADAPCEDEDGDAGSWLNWQTPYAGENGGMVFIGEKDSPAELMLAEGVGTVRCGPRGSAIAEEVGDVEKNKYLGDNFGHRLLWKEKALEVRTGENVLLLKEDEISMMVGDTKIVACKDKIEISHKNSAVRLEKAIEVTADGKVNITGSEINLG